MNLKCRYGRKKSKNKTPALSLAGTPHWIATVRDGVNSICMVAVELDTVNS